MRHKALAELHGPECVGAISVAQRTPAWTASTGGVAIGAGSPVRAVWSAVRWARSRVHRGRIRVIVPADAVATAVRRKRRVVLVAGRATRSRGTAVAASGRNSL